MKNFLLTLVVVVLIGIIVYGLFNYKQSYSLDKDKQYQRTIDSLAIEIGKKDSTISTLDSTRAILDSLILVNKNKLKETAKEAAKYKQEYEKEHDRLNNMSDDDIISTFTTAFK